MWGWVDGQKADSCQDPETERLKMCGHNVWYCERDRLNVGVGGWAKGRPLTKRCQDPETERLKMCGHNVWYCERDIG